MITNFILKSNEIRNDTHQCIFVAAYPSKDGKSFKIRVNLDKAIPANIYNTAEDLKELIISPHFEEHYVYPEIKPLPCYVYMMAPKNGTWEEGPYEILDWGIIEDVEQ